MTGMRLAAARALLAIDSREGTLGSVLEEARRPGADPRDAGLLTELTAGVLRWRNELDAVIAAAGRRSVRGIDPPVLAVLRVGAYQLRHLDRVPDHAVVHESVEAVRAIGAASAAGFVNAVLRAIIRRGPAIALPPRPTSGRIDAQVNYLSITLSHPAWLVRRWIERLGFDAAEAWCRFNNTVAGATVRAVDGAPADITAARLREAGVTAEPTPFVSDALRLPPGALGTLPADVRAGLWVQDEGAQLVARFAAARPGERVLDLCASPGGKTLVLASDLGWPGTATAARGLVAADYRARRVTLLRETLERAGLDVPVVQLDGRGPLPFAQTFECVVIDAPCSGLGTLRRDPDLKWARTANELAEFAADQRRMLHAAADLVVAGGRIVYATCSSEPEENEAVIDAFLDADGRFVAADPASRPGVSRDLLDARGHLATRPDRHQLEVFHAAVLVRREAA